MIYRCSIIAIGFLALLSFSCSNFQQKNSLNFNEEIVEVVTVNQESKFFYSTPIFQCSDLDTPCIYATIEKVAHSMTLDLGFSGAVALRDPFFSLITPKKFLYTTSFYDVGGCEYKQNVYRMPKIEIEALKFLDYSLTKENDEFKKNTSFDRKEISFNSEEEPAGRLGAALFRASNLLINANNSEIAFCDSMDTLSKEGYLLENFTKVPLLFDQGFVEFEATLFNQTMHCLLDTGCSWNFFKADLDEQSLEEAISDTKNIKYSSLVIGSQEFDSIPFHQIPIKTPFDVQVILGMTFLANHVVFIDFVHGNIYVAKADLAKNSH